MEGKVDESTDLISDLPLSILHRILSFLPFEYSVRTSVLSEKWNSVGKSFPLLKFRLPDYAMDFDDETPQYKESLINYLHFVDTTLQYFVQNKLRIESMDLDLRGIRHKSIPLFNTWLSIALHNGVSDLSSNLYENDIETIFVVNSSRLLGSTEFFRLQKLHLNDVWLSEKVVHDIIHNCPSLTDLDLHSVHGLETLNISKPNKLTSISMDFDIEIKSVYVDAPNLRCFSLEVVDEPYFPCEVDLKSDNLRELRLLGIAIADVPFHLLISRFPVLEDICIKFCNSLEKIRISLQRLNYLEISRCTKLKSIVFDAPSLSKFDFYPFGPRFPYLDSEHAIPGSMYFMYDMNFTRTRIENFWFLLLGEYFSFPFKGVTFHPYHARSKIRLGSDKLSFDHDKLGKDHMIPPLVELDCLDLTILNLGCASYWVTMLDGLLWSCQLKKICVKLNTDFNDEGNSFKILCEMLLRRSECQLCHNLSDSKCWRSLLKAAKLESIGGISFDSERAGGIGLDQFIRSFEESEIKVKAVFRLEWSLSAINVQTVLRCPLRQQIKAMLPKNTL